MISSRAKQKNPPKTITRKGAKRSPPPPAITTSPSVATTNNNKPTGRQASEPHRRKSATPPPAGEKINLISAGIFALKNKSASTVVLDAQTSLPSQQQKHQQHKQPSTMPSQSSTDFVIFDHNGNGPATGHVTPTPDFDLIQINETHETGFHSAMTAAATAKIKFPNAAVKNSTNLISKAGLSASSDKKTGKAAFTVGGASVKAKKKSRAQKAINVFKSQTSASASNKEKKVTKTLAIVLIVFLVCW